MNQKLEQCLTTGSLASLATSMIAMVAIAFPPSSPIDYFSTSHKILSSGNGSLSWWEDELSEGLQTHWVDLVVPSISMDFKVQPGLLNSQFFDTLTASQPPIPQSVELFYSETTSSWHSCLVEMCRLASNKIRPLSEWLNLANSPQIEPAAMDPLSYAAAPHICESQPAQAQCF